MRLPNPKYFPAMFRLAAAAAAADNDHDDLKTRGVYKHNLHNSHCKQKNILHQYIVR